MRGSVRKPRTSGGTWSYRLDLDVDAAGQRFQKQVGGFRTKKEAQTALNEALSSVQHGTYVAPSRQTVAEFLSLWIDGVKSELAITAWSNYRMVVNFYIVPHLGSKRLTELTPVQIKAWHTKLLEHGRKDGTGLASRSVQLAHRVLHRALADAVRWNLLMVNPASRVRAPKANSAEMQAWTPEEAVRFLGGVAETRLLALWIVALHTGLRRGELAGLRWKDIDVAGATLTVAQQRTTADYAVVVMAPKAKSQRQLQLAPATIAAIEAHRKRQRIERVAAGPAWENTGYVFVNELGQPYHPSRLREMFEKDCIRVGVPAIRLHDLRHTMATLALQAGVHPKIVQEQLGHSAINVTLDIYSHVPQAVKREAAGKIAGIFEL